MLLMAENEPNQDWKWSLGCILIIIILIIAYYIGAWTAIYNALWWWRLWIRWVFKLL